MNVADARRPMNVQRWRAGEDSVTGRLPYNNPSGAGESETVQRGRPDGCSGGRGRSWLSPAGGALRLEHDDRALLDRHAARVPRLPEDVGDGGERAPLGLAEAAAVDGIADVDFELGGGPRVLERDE